MSRLEFFLEHIKSSETDSVLSFIVIVFFHLG